MAKSKLIWPGPHGRWWPRPQTHDKVIWPGWKIPNRLRNTIIWPGPKWRPHKRVDLEKVREIWKEIWKQFTEKKKLENRLKVLEILNNILANKMEEGE